MKPIVTLLLCCCLVAVVVAVAAENDSAPAATNWTQPSAQGHWAYQPVYRPQTPQIQNKDWVRSPIDALVLARMEAKGVKPSPDADRAKLIRRATLDAWGMVPTPEQVKAFVEDRSPDAYEKLVDRLLASPHYGERWGRRWLDLTRYADSEGYNQDETRPNAWHYRDYVVKSFNQDKPYDRFIKEQLAGDEIWPGDMEAFTATGFLRNYADETNARDLNLKYQEIQWDLTDTTGYVFLGTTLGCAKCHNHKFDKISQKEYYQFQAFFANASAKDDVEALSGKELADYNQRLAVYKEATKSIQDQIDGIIKPKQAKLREERVSSFVPETIPSLTKPASERNAFDKWVYHRSGITMKGQDRTAITDLTRYKDPDRDKYYALVAELKKFDNLNPGPRDLVSGMFELGPDSPPTHVLVTGVYNRPAAEVEPGFLSMVSGDRQPVIVPTATSSGRRTALANWIADPKNPLTARVMVNRIWYQDFGHGIVDSVSDFGKMGEKPTNPELLDWLASEFVQQGWSIKKLQREIMLSSVYRQASDFRQDAAAVDPDNKLMWAFPRLRMDAEEIRDSMLLAAGLLNEKMGGPGVRPPVPKNLGAGNAWQVTPKVEEHDRRSVYVFIRRNIPYPMLEVFDMASAQLVHSKRDVTTTAPQALTLINDDLYYQWSEALAGRVIKEGGTNFSAGLDRLFQLLYGRSPDAWEKDTLQTFLSTQEKTIAEQKAAGKPIAAPAGFTETQEWSATRAAAFVDLVHAMANSNEFTYRF
ncbi:MAG TPA: DUF1549 and DUF1553 domain-containing protein [Bryobacteraceae bacterium]|nr:DUF1549 and DUF1553 domain-containing protein [Bryobacteraceae bacterium]